MPRTEFKIGEFVTFKYPEKSTWGDINGSGMKIGKKYKVARWASSTDMSIEVSIGENGPRTWGTNMHVFAEACENNIKRNLPSWW